MIELPVPCSAAPDEMLTMTPSPDSLQQRREGADRRERSPHIGGQHLVDQIVVERFEIVVRHHPGEPGGIDQDVGAAVFARAPPRRPCGFRAVSSSGRRIALWPLPASFAHRAGALDALVVADDDPRAGLGEQPRAGAPMPLLAPVMTATLPSRSLPIRAAMPSPPLISAG